MRALANGDVQVTMPVWGNLAGPAFRVRDGRNYWRAIANLAGVWRLDKVVDGTATLMASGSGSISPGVVVRVRCEGTSIALYVNGSLVCSVTDSTFQDEPRAGLYSAGVAAARFDDFSASYVWTDVSAYVMGASWKRGRQHELDRVEAGTARVTLNNRDRRFEPEYPGSPYYPFVLPMRRVKVEATASAVTYGRFFGYVERWPLEWNPVNTDGTVKIEAVDELAVGAYRLFDAYSTAVNALRPRAYYRLGDSVTAPVDSGPNGYAAGTVSGTAPTVGSPGLISALAGDNGSLKMAVTTKVAIPNQAGLSGTGDFTFVALVQQGGLGGPWAVFTQTLNGARTLAVWLTDLATTGFVATVVQGATVVTGTTASGKYGTSPHIVAVVRRNGVVELWVDSVQDATTSAAVTGDVTADAVFVGYDAPGAHAPPDYLDEVAWWDRALTAAEIAALGVSSGVARAAAGQTTGQRVTAVADLLGFSPSKRSIDTGRSTMQGADLSNSTPREHLDLIAGTEEGLIFVDGSGRLVFRDRNDAYTQTIVDTWGDGGGAELPYLDLQPSYDIDRIYNDIRLQRDGGFTQAAADLASQVRYQTRTLTRTVAENSDTATATHASWLLGRYKDPDLRVESMTVAGNVVGWSHVLPRELGDRLTVTRRPNNGTALSFPVVIEALEETVTPDNWLTTWQLAPVPSMWILGDATFSVLGSTTVLGF